MVSVQLKGVHVVRVRLKAGVREYHYAWRGGPRLEGAPGSAAYIAAFNAAHAARKAPSKGTLAEIVADYRAAPAYTRLSDHTRRAYKGPLDEIVRRWGDAPTAAIEDPAIRRAFLAWRDSMADRPRTADMAIGVLKRVLAWAEERVMITANQAAPIGRLHHADKAEDIWTAADLEALEAHASTELAWAVRLALNTGLRQGDLIRLSWNHVQGEAIELVTSKRRRRVLIPITPALRQLLGEIEKRGPVILSTQRGGRPWTGDGLRASFSAARERAGVQRTFHDLRRTAATTLLAAGLDDAQVAMIMGWSAADIESMKRRYVSRTAVVKAVLAKLERAT